MKFLLRIAAGLVCAPALLCASAWRPSGPWGGSATAIWVDKNNPETLLAGARNSLIFRSRDGGASWARLPFPHYFDAIVSAVAIQPGNPQFYLAGVQQPQSQYAGVWYSEDTGATWRMSTGLEGNSIQALTFWAKNPERVAAATRDGVWLSTDSGRNWKRISAPYNHEMRAITAVAIDPEDSNIVYAGTTHLPWKTTDGGKTWESIHDGMIDDTDVFSIFIDPANPTRVLASACSGIYRSENAGTSWTKFSGIPASHRRTHVIRQHPENREVIYAGTTLGLLKSVNGGATFRQLNNLPILSMAFDPRNPERLYLATDGAGLWRSEDGGKTLDPINEGFVSRRVVGLTTADGELYANVIQDGEAGGIFTSADGGVKWTLASSASVLRDNHITKIAGCPSYPKFLLAGNATRALRTVNGGDSWREVKLLKGEARLFAIACVNTEAEKPLLLAGTDQGLLGSADLGVTWRTIKLTTANIKHSVADIYTSAASPHQVAVRTGQAIYLSEDSGATWRALNIMFPVGLVYDVALASGSQSAILVATAHGLYASEDGGRTWQRRQSGMQPGTVSTLAVRPGRGGEIYAAQFGTIYRSDNKGRDWRPLRGAEMEGVTLRKLAFHDGEGSRLLALTSDLGVFYLELIPDRVHN